MAREARGLELSDVAEQIRVRPTQLAAIEAEDWAAIGAPVYIRGFLRTYARFLGLDGEEAVADFNALGAVARPEQTVESPRMRRGDERRGLSPLLYLASAIAIVLIAFVVYNYFTLGRQGNAVAVASPPAASSVPLPSNSTNSTVGVDSTAGALPVPTGGVATSPSPAPVALATGPNTIGLVLSGPSWLRVTIDGSVSIEGTFPAGTIKSFNGKTATVRIGNAGAVDVYVDGQSVGKLGGLGEVADRTFKL